MKREILSLVVSVFSLCFSWYFFSITHVLIFPIFVGYKSQVSFNWLWIYLFQLISRQKITQSNFQNTHQVYILAGLNYQHEGFTRWSWVLVGILILTTPKRPLWVYGWWVYNYIIKEVCYFSFINVFVVSGTMVATWLWRGFLRRGTGSSHCWLHTPWGIKENISTTLLNRQYNSLTSSDNHLKWDRPIFHLLKAW